MRRIALALLVFVTLVSSAMAEENQRGGAIALPDFPLPKDAQLEKIRYSAFYRTSGSAQSVIDFFMKQMSAAGWKSAQETPFHDQSGALTLQYQKDEFSMAIFVNQFEHHTSIMVGISKDEPRSIMELSRQ